MAFRKINEKQNLTGFYRRIKGNTMQGIVTKFIDMKNGPFFIVKLTAGTCKVSQQSTDGKTYKDATAKSGDWIGLGAATTIRDTLKGYIGSEVKVTWTGETPSKNFPKNKVQLFDVEINDEKPEEDSSIR
jgi:hypothetical protein